MLMLVLMQNPKWPAAGAKVFVDHLLWMAA